MVQVENINENAQVISANVPLVKKDGAVWSNAISRNRSSAEYYSAEDLLVAGQNLRDLRDQDLRNLRDQDLREELKLVYGTRSPVGWGMFLSIPVTFLFFFIGFLLYITKKNQVAQPPKEDEHYCYPRIVAHGGSAPAIYQSVPYADPHDIMKGGDLEIQTADYAIPDIVSTATVRIANHNHSPLNNHNNSSLNNLTSPPGGNPSSNNLTVPTAGNTSFNNLSLPVPDNMSMHAGADLARPEGMFVRNAQRRKSGISRRWASEDWENDESFISTLASRLSRKQSRPEITEL